MSESLDPNPSSPPNETPIAERPVWTYAKAVAWLLPALVFLNFAMLFLVPKFAAISEQIMDSQLPSITRVLIGGSAYFIQIGSIAFTLWGGLLVLFELKASPRAKRRWRGVLAGIVPWSLNLVALTLLTSLCLQPAIMLPLLHQREKHYRAYLTESGQLDAAQSELPEKLRHPSKWDRLPDPPEAPPPADAPAPDTRAAPH